VEEEGEREDPRRYIPLPWSRISPPWGIGQFIQIWLLQGRTFLLIIISWILFLLVSCWLAKLRRRRLGEEVRRRGQRFNRVVWVVLFPLSFLTVLVLAALWLALAWTELAPGETYVWDGWWVDFWFTVWTVWALYILLALGVYALGRRWLWRQAVP
jgi:hypothetical protein